MTPRVGIDDCDGDIDGMMDDEGVVCVGVGESVCGEGEGDVVSGVSDASSCATSPIMVCVFPDDV